MAKTPEIDVRDHYQRNYVINGAFDIWQRGTSFATVTGFEYQPDRFWNNKFNDALNVDRIDISSLNMVAQYAARYEKVSGSGFWSCQTNMETSALNSMKGKKMIASCKIRKSASFTSDMTLTLRTTNDEAITGSTVEQSQVSISNADINSVTFTEFSVILDVPSNTTAVGMEWQLTADGQAGAAGVYFEVTEVQIREGAEVLPFVRAGGTVGMEELLCKRFYWRPASREVHCAGFWETTTSFKAAFMFPVRMRVIPTPNTLTITNFIISRRGSSNANPTGITYQTTGTGGVSVFCTGATASNAGDGAVMFNNSEDTFEFDAEL